MNVTQAARCLAAPYQLLSGIRWNDPDLAIEWPIAPKEVLTSEKDLKQPLLKDAVLFD